MSRQQFDESSAQRQPTTMKPPKNHKRGFLNFINRLFGFLKACIEIVFSIIKNAMTLLVYLFRYIVELLAHPTMPSVVAITFFTIFVVIAGYQWYGIGVWLFQMFGLSEAWGIGGGLFGLLLGFGINVYQLAPELWKLQPLIAKAYSDLHIDPEAELEKPTLKEKLTQWLTYDHGTLKGMRLMSYCIETGLVLTYTAIVGQFQFWAICVAAASLLAPEWTLKGVAATTGVTRAVSDRVSQMQDDEDEMKKFGF
jgi:hypothetical protein